MKCPYCRAESVVPCRNRDEADDCQRRRRQPPRPRRPLPPAGGERPPLERETVDARDVAAMRAAAAAPVIVGPAWTRQPRGIYGRADYLHSSGARVVWCGHPTALRPYYVRLPDGRALDIYDNGSGPGFTTFRTVADAKAAAETAVG
jgi:hypothetical protein